MRPAPASPHRLPSAHGHRSWRLLALLTLTVAGCGGREQPAAMEARQIRSDPAAQAAERYLRAGAEGDLRTACALQTRAELVERGGDGTVDTCVTQGEALDAEVRRATQEISAAAFITRVDRVDERTRLVRFAIDPERISEFAGQDLDVKPGRLTMVRSGGGWRLDEYAVGDGPQPRRNRPENARRSTGGASTASPSSVTA